MSQKNKGAELPTIAVASIESLIPDEENANRGTERGANLIRHSIREHGAGRSVLLDSEGRIIAGNKTTQAARDEGITDVIVVKVTGNQLVAVQRTDLDLTEVGGKARQMSWEDNRAAELGLNWDAAMLAQYADDGANLEAGFNDDELSAILATATNDTRFLDTFIEPAPAPVAPRQTPLPMPPVPVSSPAPVASVKTNLPDLDVIRSLAPSASVTQATATVPNEPDVNDEPDLTQPVPPMVINSQATLVKETVTWPLVMDPVLRDEVVRAMNARKAALGVDTHVQVLCHLLGIAFHD